MQTISKQIHADENFKAGYEQSLLRALYFNQLNPPIYICKEVFMTIPEVFYVKKDYFLLDELNRKIEMLKASGLIEFWSFHNINKEMMNVQETKFPKVLKLRQFKGSFNILLIGLGISFVVFVYENVKFRFE
jgi:hypothetical protein